MAGACRDRTILVMNMTIAPAALPKRLLLIKAQNFKHSAGYALYGKPPRWHKVTAEHPAPKGAPRAAHPHAVAPAQPVSHFTDAEWDQLKLPQDNVNAATYNRQLERLRQMSDNGDVTAILASGFGTNTYSKRLAIIANKLLKLHGVDHQVAPGQKLGTHAAIQGDGVDLQGQPARQQLDLNLDSDRPSEQASVEAAADPAAQQSPQAEEQSPQAEAPAGLAMPEFQEGKTVSGVVDYYQGVASKILAMAAAGDTAGLARMKADGLKPNAKGKISNTWAGKTPNSKLLLDLHARAMGNAPADQPAPAVSAETVPAPAAQAAEASTAPAVDKSAKQVEKLRAVADSLDAKADEALGRNRNTNTARRARMAGSAIDSALADQAMASTIRNLADAIESGEAKNLSGVTSKAQVETLQALLRGGMYETDRGLSYGEQQKRKGRDPEPQDIRNARMPDFTMYGGIANTLANSLDKVRGGAKLARKLRAAAGYDADGRDRKISLTEDEAREIVAKLKGSGDKPWQLDEALKKTDRLKRMGITNNNQLQRALAEFVMFRAGKKAEDPVAKMERELVGQKVGVDFFPTPKALASRMAEMAGIKPGMKVLEPSAGSGNLADAARAAGAEVDAVEVSPQLSKLLEAKGHKLVGTNFDEFEAPGEYDAVIMNPPFGNRQDATHIQRAYDMLKPGGKLVAIAGEGVFFGSDKKAEEFRSWLDDRGAEVEKLPAGTFEDKSLLATTGANARLMVLQKPAAAASKAEDGPREGERNADGLVFRDGRWHRDEEVGQSSEQKTAADPAPRMKNYGWDRVKLAEAYSIEQLNELRKQVEADHANPRDEKGRYLENGKPSIYLFDKKGRQKLDNIGWAIYYHQQERSKAGQGVEATADKPRQVLVTKVDQQAHEAATSPHNDSPAPTPAQLEAGNYKKGHVSVQGIDITVENPRGSVRTGKRPDGSTWDHTMSDHYGYIKRTTGADAEHIDVYVGDHHDSDKVFVVDQVNAAGEFDEHKVMLGFKSKAEATAAYSSNFDKGWKVGPVTELSVDDFKSWLEQGETSKPLAMKDEGPKDGETKQGENGATLVFRNGRWHRQGGDQPAPEDDGLSDDPNSPNYRYRDTGDIAGSRKAMAAERIKLAAKNGERLRRTDIDWGEIEKNPREARELIKKSNLFGKVGWQGLKASGMEPGAGFLIDRVYASIPQEPDRDSPQKRQDYALALETIRERLERCKNPDEVTGVLAEIREEIEGTMLTVRESQAYEAAREEAKALRQKADDAKAVSDAYYKAWSTAQNEVNKIKFEQEKRERRGWKPDASLEAQLADAQAESDAAEKVWKSHRDAHPELQSKKREYEGGGFNYLNDLEYEAYMAGKKASAIMQAAKARNLLENPVTRAWLTLGPRFMGVVNWRSYKGSDAFSGHVTNAKRGTIKDWSWAEKDGVAVKKASKKAVSFQLKVAENYEREGGRDVSVESTAALKEKFNLRDVQSGNWVLNDPGSAAFHVQRAAEAFADLADIIGVSDEHVSMNGRLAMAFGARGKGNAGYKGAARAHYEPVQRVINLTKMGGGGALGHEWFHALDNLVLEAEGIDKSEKDTYLSERPTLLPAGELRDAFVNLRKAMTEGNVRGLVTVQYSDRDVRLAKANVHSGSPVGRMVLNAKDAASALIAVQDYFNDRYKDQKVSRKTQNTIDAWRRIAVAHHGGKADGDTVTLRAGGLRSNFMNEAHILDEGQLGRYWSEPHEMAARAFQAYVEDKLAEQGRKNDYLSVYADNKYHVDPIFGPLKPYPEGEERKRLNAAFDHLMGVLAKRGTLAKAMALMVA